MRETPEWLERVLEYEDLSADERGAVDAFLAENSAARRLLEQLRSVDIRMALYPLSAFRAMNAAALRVFRELREHGTQQGVVDAMQTREELYEFLDYHQFERKLDELFSRNSR